MGCEFGLHFCLLRLGRLWMESLSWCEFIEEELLVAILAAEILVLMVARLNFDNNRKILCVKVRSWTSDIGRYYECLHIFITCT